MRRYKNKNAGMTYSAESMIPEKFNEVNFDIQMPFYSERVRWNVSTINTFANFLITTTDDFITINNRTYHFKDKTSYDLDTLCDDINSILFGAICRVSMNSNGCIQFHGEGDFTINEISPRVQMLLGLYGKLAENIQDFIAPTPPQLTLGNILYLRSIQGNALGTYKDNHPSLTPICYRINTFLKPGLPIIINKKQDVIETNYDSITKIKIELLDRNFNPVVLKSPLKIDIKIIPVF